jgi:hypothetical protein
MPELKEKVVEGEDIQDFAYLGREFMTWLVWRADAGESSFGGGAKGEEFTLAFGTKARLGAPVGHATDLVLKGRSPAHGAEARAAIGSGHTLREAELRCTSGEREWRFTLVAETLDLRGVKLPALLTEEDDDKFLERISLIEELDEMVRTAFASFMKDRLRPAWKRDIVPALRTWLVEGLEVTD